MIRSHLSARDHGVTVPAPAPYMIRINGCLGATVLSAFPAPAPQHHGAHTVLTGLLDRSALYGVLGEIEALGLDLLEMQKLTLTADHQGQVTAAHCDRQYRRARPFRYKKVTLA